MESLEWRILDRVSSRNFILGGEAHRSLAVRPWRGEGRPYNYGISWGEVELLGGGGRGGELPLRSPLLDETLLEGIMKNPMEPCTCCCITHRR